MARAGLFLVFVGGFVCGGGGRGTREPAEPTMDVWRNNTRGASVTVLGEVTFPLHILVM